MPPIFHVEHADCIEAMKQLAVDSIDSIVTDPPYGLSFMGKDWDHGIPGVPFWAEALRVAKSGAHLLAFGGTRTFHRLAVAIEDAGWEIRDCVMWVYGSGFPKSMNVQQAMNKAARGFPQGSSDPESPNHGKFKGGRGMGAGAGTFMAEQSSGRGGDEGPWHGWGTALKPAWEPIIVARKSLVGTVAANVEQFGTGAINIDGCRVSTEGEIIHTPQSNPANRAGVVGTDLGISGANADDLRASQAASVEKANRMGRFPANLIHDGSEEVVELFPSEAGASGKASGPTRGKLGTQGRFGTSTGENMGESKFYGDTGSAARFFYCAKTSKADRGGENEHPTVKPTDLMRYLCRLVTPPGGVVLDPFCGSGSTGKAAILEGFNFLGIEKEAQYVEIARKRIEAATK